MENTSPCVEQLAGWGHPSVQNGHYQKKKKKSFFCGREKRKNKPVPLKVAVEMGNKDVPN